MFGKVLNTPLYCLSFPHVRFRFGLLLSNFHRKFASQDIFLSIRAALEHPEIHTRNIIIIFSLQVFKNFCCHAKHKLRVIHSFQSIYVLVICLCLVSFV